MTWIRALLLYLAALARSTCVTLFLEMASPSVIVIVNFSAQLDVITMLDAYSQVCPQ